MHISIIHVIIGHFFPSILLQSVVFNKIDLQYFMCYCTFAIYIAQNILGSCFVLGINNTQCKYYRLIIFKAVKKLSYLKNLLYSVKDLNPSFHKIY